MKRLSRNLARQWTHEVACWLTFERETGAFPKRRWPAIGEYKFGADLGGTCFLASFILRRVLEFNGYRAGVLFDDVNRHAYVTTTCGWSLDATIMQFADEWPAELPIEPSIYRTSGSTFGCYGVVPRALIHREYEGQFQGPAWPGYYVDVISRVLRRMGVDTLEASS
jgi:hypothetical protein